MAPRGIKLLARFVGELSRRKVPRAAGAYLVMAFIVMQVVDDVFPYVPGLAADSAGTAVLLVLALGFPLTVTLAWVWEVTPQGVRRELSAEEATREAGARAALVKPLRRDSVAVLAFENLSADPDNEYFSDGITDGAASRCIALRRTARSAPRSSSHQSMPASTRTRFSPRPASGRPFWSRAAATPRPTKRKTPAR
jgi:hypothetical protein